MYNNYSEFIDAIDGYDLTLTIDATIQSYAEKTLEEGIKAYDVRNGALPVPNPEKKKPRSKQSGIYSKNTLSQAIPLPAMYRP